MYGVAECDVRVSPCITHFTVFVERSRAGIHTRKARLVRAFLVKKKPVSVAYNLSRNSPRDRGVELIFAGSEKKSRIPLHSIYEYDAQGLRT